MNENDKDYSNPIFEKIYIALATCDPGTQVSDWLNANGFANLTVCPVCRIDDFVHSSWDRCRIADEIDKRMETA